MFRPLNMSYTIINPPFTLRLRDMSKPELLAYLSWFHNIMQERLTVLATDVGSTQGFEGWQCDFTPESLGFLGSWLAANVTTRPRTEDENKKLRQAIPYTIDTSAHELTDETFSMSFDVAIYLSKVFLSNNDKFHWSQPLRNKKDIDYGQPVLIGTGPVPFNPVRMVVTLTYGIVSGARNHSSLSELYELWKHRL